MFPSSERLSLTVRPCRRFRPPLPSRWQAAVALGLILVGAWARPALDPDTQALLVEAVTAAVELDAYHARCRGDVSGRRTENLNKLLASKLRLTVIGVQDEFFPERNYRKAQERLERAFVERLQALGGCQGAKESTLPEELRQRYNQALEGIQALP